MRNGLPSAPLRFCVKNTGPFEVAFTAIAMPINSGDRASSTVAAKQRSNSRFGHIICICTVLTGDVVRLMVARPETSVIE